MTQQEFFNRTGVEVSNDEFWAINEMYNNCEVDKDEFCKFWCKMNPARVNNAKIERKWKEREESYKNVLQKWYEKWNRNNQKFNEYYFTKMAYTKLSHNEVKAMSFAEINLDDVLSHVHYKVGHYLGKF